jgi:hypothetical protein
MIKKLTPAFLILFLFLFLLEANGQQNVNVPDYLTLHFKKYCESVPREEIYVHTDREEYLAGEDLWFNLYLIDRCSYKPSSKSRIAYFELLNAENRPVVQKRILLTKGFGPGQIIIPDTLSSGVYSIRVYTSWMKNFLPYNCFIKDINIYNTFNTRAFTGKRMSIKNKESEIIKEQSNNITKSGLTLSVNNLLPDILEISVVANESYSVENGNQFYLFIQTHGNINRVSTEKLTEGKTTISLTKSLLASGINQITLFNSKGQPLAERFIYTPEKEKQNLTLQSIDSCGKRSEFSLSIKSGNDSFKFSDLSNLSISAASKTHRPETIDLTDYLIPGTEFGIFPWNKIKGKKISELPPEVMDSILLNVRSNWIIWTTILSEDLPHFKYPFEKEDHALLGKILPADKNTVSPDEYILLCTPGKEAGFQYAQTDNEGNFRFNIHIDEGVKDLIIMPDEVNKKQKISIESSFSYQYQHSEISSDSLKRTPSPLISKWSINYQLKTIYGVSSTGSSLNPALPPSGPIRFYGKPDIHLILADYVSLPMIDEVFLELLPHVSLKKKKSAYEISIVSRIGETPTLLSPRLLIDGVIIKDPSLIGNLDPENVEKIDVIKENYYVGRFLFTGLVNVITKTGDFSGIPLPDYMIRLTYRVTDPVFSFNSPDYSSAEIKNSRVPDFRNTLYWNPSVKPDKQGNTKVSFWTSDFVSDYEINIQGITSEGKPVSIRKFIRVK